MCSSSSPGSCRAIRRATRSSSSGRPPRAAPCRGCCSCRSRSPRRCAAPPGGPRRRRGARSSSGRGGGLLPSFSCAPSPAGHPALPRRPAGAPAPAPARPPALARVLVAAVPREVEVVFEAPEEYQQVGGLAYYSERRITLLEPPGFVPPTYLAGHTREMFLARAAFELRWRAGERLAFVSDPQRR